jgi:pimeloyl-ACP methyl ester carboxylesterase
MSEIVSMYLHGLGRDELRKAERVILERHRRKGIKVVPVFIDWRSAETFPQLLERVANQASDLLSTINSVGRLILEGSSAGGSLALNTAGKLKKRHP